MTRRKFDRFMVDVEIARNLKRAKLSPAERCCHVEGVLALAAKSPIRGHLLVGDEPAEAFHVAKQADVALTVARNTMAKLRDRGILLSDPDLGCEYIHDWHDWNPAPKPDPTNAERQDRHRKRVQARNAASNATHNGASNGEVTDPVTPTEVEGEGKELPSGSSSSEIAKATPDTLRLSHLLADLIRQRDPKAKVTPESNGWLAQVRLLLADRADDAAEVEQVLRWSQADPFWQSNILSPAKLRKQFTQLTIKMKVAPIRAVAQPVADVVAEGDRLIAEALREAS